MLMKSRWNLALDTGPVQTRPQARGNPRTGRPRAAPMGLRSPAAGCGITLVGPAHRQSRAAVACSTPHWPSPQSAGPPMSWVSGPLDSHRARHPRRTRASPMRALGGRAGRALGGPWGSILRGAACPTGSPRPAGAVRCLNGGPDARPEASLATKRSTLGRAPHRLPCRGEAPAALAPSAHGVGFAVGSRQNPPIPAWN